MEKEKKKRVKMLEVEWSGKISWEKPKFISLFCGTDYDGDGNDDDQTVFVQKNNNKDY